MLISRLSEGRGEAEAILMAEIAQRSSGLPEILHCIQSNKERSLVAPILQTDGQTNRNALCGNSGCRSTAMGGGWGVG